jgi:hypothetical protein
MCEATVVLTSRLFLLISNYNRNFIATPCPKILNCVTFYFHFSDTFKKEVLQNCIFQSHVVL